MDIDIGKGVVNVGREYVNKGMQRVNLSMLHPYFNVDNSYIIKKILLIIFPFKNHFWKARNFNTEDTYSVTSHRNLNDNIRSTESRKLCDPDIYIPMMGLCTYILVCSMNLGFQQKFSPEKVTKIFMKCLTLEIITTLIVKLISYLLGVSELGVLDFLSFSGYKFVVILLIQLFCNKMINVLLGQRIHRFLKILYIIYLYSAFFFFLSRSLKGKVLREGKSQRRKKIYFLFITVFLEVFLVFLLS